MWTGSTRQMLSSGWLVYSGTNLVPTMLPPNGGSHSYGHGWSCWLCSFAEVVPVFSPSLSFNVRNASPSLQLAHTLGLRWQSLRSFSQQQTQPRPELLGRASIQSVIHFQKGNKPESHWRQHQLLGTVEPNLKRTSVTTDTHHKVPVSFESVA